MTVQRVLENEGHVKAEVKKILTKLGCFFFMPPSNVFGRAGISDFIGLHRGRFFAIETKFGKNKPTALQTRFGIEVMAHGGLFFVINETNISDLWDLEGV